MAPNITLLTFHLIIHDCLQDFFLLFMCCLYVFRLCEAVYAARRCRRLGLDSLTTAKWTASAFVSGLFALRLLPSDPRAKMKS